MPSSRLNAGDPQLFKTNNRIPGLTELTVELTGCAGATS